MLQKINPKETPNMISYVMILKDSCSADICLLNNNKLSDSHVRGGRITFRRNVGTLSSEIYQILSPQSSQFCENIKSHRA
jgi:hypothetical protein